MGHNIINHHGHTVPAAQRVTSTNAIDLLPPALRCRLCCAKAWVQAVEKGYICPYADGTLCWTLSHSALAYFVGRLFCGDAPTTGLSGQRIWGRGKGRMPAKALQALFGVEHLSMLRSQRLLMPLPKVEGFGRVDGLFN